MEGQKGTSNNESRLLNRDENLENATYPEVISQLPDEFKPYILELSPGHRYIIDRYYKDKKDGFWPISIYGHISSKRGTRFGHMLECSWINKLGNRRERTRPIEEYLAFGNYNRRLTRMFIIFRKQSPGKIKPMADNHSYIFKYILDKSMEINLDSFVDWDKDENPNKINE